MKSRQLSRRSFLALSAGVTAGSVLAACAPAAAPAPQVVKETVEVPVEKVVKETVVVQTEKVVVATPAPAPEGPVSIRILLWEQGAELDLYKQLMTHFTELNPDIAMEVESPPGSFDVKLQTLIAAGQAPDVIRTGDSTYPSYVVRGALENLDPFAAAQADWNKDDFLPGPYDVYVFQGSLWSVCDCPVGRGLFYNKTIFDKEGLPYPDESWTWNTMLENAQKLTKRTGDRTDQFGMMFYNWNNCYETMVVQNGGNIVDEAMTKCLLRQPEAYDAIQWWADLSNKSKVAPLAADISAGVTFQSGRVAMSCQEGSWMVAEFLKIRQSNPEFNWEYGLLPKSPTGVNILVLNTAGFSMASQTKYKEQVWKFLNYMSRDGSELEATLGSGSYIPIRKSSIEKPGLYYKADAGYNQKAVVQGIEAGISPRLKHANGAEIWRAINSNSDAVWLGTKSAQEGLTAAADLVDFLLPG